MYTVFQSGSDTTKCRVSVRIRDTSVVFLSGSEILQCVVYIVLLSGSDTTKCSVSVLSVPVWIRNTLYSAVGLFLSGVKILQRVA